MSPSDASLKEFSGATIGLSNPKRRAGVHKDLIELTRGRIQEGIANFYAHCIFDAFRRFQHQGNFVKQSALQICHYRANSWASGSRNKAGFRHRYWPELIASIAP